VLVSVVGVILLPVTNYNRNKNDQLQGQLEDANKRISELVKLEERQRIARDLHDTLGQKLSLIGLKSDLAGKLMKQDMERAQAEINDVRQTARTALKEVREMVTRMRGTRLADEIFRIRQILKAAQIERMAGAKGVMQALRAGQVQVAAGIRQVLEAEAAADAGLRMLPGRFMVIQQAMGTPASRGAQAGAALATFVEEMKAGGFVAEALARHKVHGASVAPAA